MSVLLDIQAVTKRFAGVTALDGLNLKVSEGSITSVIGPNGSGKTSLMNVITGFYQADGGSVRLRGTELVGLASHRIARAGVTRTFQHIRLFRELSVFDNVLVGAERVAPRGARQRTQAMLERLGLQDRAAVRADALSYGHQRRLEIARGLAAEPSLLVLDEPAAGMNAGEKQELDALLRDVREQGVTLLLVEHDMELIMGISDHVAAINFGRLLTSGPPDAVRRHPQVIEAYLGREHEPEKRH